MAGCSTDHVGNQVGAGKIIPDVVVCPDVASVANPNQVTSLVDVPAGKDFTLKISSADGIYSGTWQTISSYFPVEAILPGSYNIEAYYGSPLIEGFDVPYYYGCASCNLADGGEEKVEIECRLANTLVVVDFDRSAKDYFPELVVRLHSYGGGYIDYPKSESRYAYLKPGKIYVGMVLRMPDGRECDFMVTEVDDAKAGMWFPIKVCADKTDTDSPVVTVSFDDKVNADDISVVLSPEFVNSPAPAISCDGFVAGVPVSMIEGQTPSQPLVMTVPAANVSHLILTTIAPSLIEKGWKADMDIMAATDLSSLTALGLKVQKGENITLDFTDLVPKLRDTDGLPDCFTLQAIAPNGKESAPTSLMVDLSGAEVRILSVSAPVVGIDEATFKVYCDTDPANTLSLTMSDGKSWIPLAISSITKVESEAHVYCIDFKVPSGTASIPVRLNYCGLTRVETELKRLSPEFDIEVDAFALKAIVRIKPKDESLLKTITSLARIYAGNELTAQISRDEEHGEIIVSGLKEKTSYRFKATVMSNPDALDFTSEVSVVTEAVSNIPNGAFEDIIERFTTFNKMLSGGRYSQNIVDIFNLQNYTDFKFTIPKFWANTNAKTFDTQAKKLNTWYVIPSVRIVEGEESYMGTSDSYFAVRLDNVAFDPAGEDIPDYLQEGEPYVRYSRNIPNIRYKAVGKLFLGSYKWNRETLTEEYNEGISFSSRPAALSGFYRFVPVLPGSSQQGYIRVELLGDGDKVISRGEGHLIPATGYTAFTVPLEYEYFGEKAKKLKVMIAASPEIGSIDHETEALVTVGDPKTSTSIGSSLWIDELKFSY
ncbi:MAG: DUF4493 domain-containing protein [Paramuribaculum sp.]|nr:DUF4493 domain-containing protein [Paramuribaculum sp.]